MTMPVTMRERETGSSSITFIRSIYYVFKVTLALFMAMVRKYADELESWVADDLWPLPTYQEMLFIK